MSLHKYEDNLFVSKSELSTFMKINDYWPLFIKNYEPHLDKHLFLASNTTQVYETDCLPKRTSALGKVRSLNDNTMGSLKKGAIRADQVASESENINFHQLICTVENLARFFKVTTNSEGLERLVTQLYQIKDKIDGGWIEILDLRAALVVFCIKDAFTLKYDSKSLLFSIFSTQDITFKAYEKLIIVLDLFVDFNRPLSFINPYEDDTSLCSFFNVFRHKSLTVVENLEMLNLEGKDITISKNKPLLQFRTIGLNEVKVYLIHEEEEKLKSRWHQDTSRARLWSNQQVIQRVSSSILPLLKRRQEIQLDLRNETLENNVTLAKLNDKICCMGHVVNEKVKIFSNKILLLNYLRNNFGISKEALEEIQRSCIRLRKKI